MESMEGAGPLHVTRSRASAPEELRGLHAPPVGRRVRDRNALDWTGLGWTVWSALDCTVPLLPFTAPLLPLHLPCTGLTLSCSFAVPLHRPALHSSCPTAAFSKEHRNEPPSLVPAHSTFRTQLWPTLWGHSFGLPQKSRGLRAC